MLDHVLSFLKEQLNSYIREKTGGQAFEVLFLQDRNGKEISLEENAITTLLVNVEEYKNFPTYKDKLLVGFATNEREQIAEKQASNLYGLHLYVLYAANFTNYRQSLTFLSLIIKYFKDHSFFHRRNSPTLSPEIKNLIIKPVNLPLTEQREVWSGLGMSYIPSVMYKVSIVCFVKWDPEELGYDVTEEEDKWNPFL
ncbi:Pvc16 family protein [Moorena sp. SIO4G3]|uniref:Pvc16 family protein n=1 Tax=Moorena sp. SIO4G3 TaxID=2607821 RepID=UPI001429FAC0|nr:Pvc16 family protein [Moorena sp. SIO4G3]NEO74980.1 DUF4255 domain-containing protein [Moorena sp. SIO4G3]